MNPYEQLAREKKARLLADVMAQKIDAYEREFHNAVDPAIILSEDSAQTRRGCEIAAGVKPASRETWEMVVGFLREREAVKRMAAR